MVSPEPYISICSGVALSTTIMVHQMDQPNCFISVTTDVLFVTYEWVKMVYNRPWADITGTDRDGLIFKVEF